MKPRLLVVSPVHPSDDPRIRHKLIGTLDADWEVTFAGSGRGPTDRTGLTWVELTGGRLQRWFRATWLVLRRGYAVASLHDPEMIPAGLCAAMFGRTVVFDVHENVPAQLRTKAWIPRPLRRPIAWVAARMLRLAEGRMAITLAESGYAGLFERSHPVFPNYLIGDPPSPRDADPGVGIVYLGDVRPERGLNVAVAAAGRAGAGLITIMGRCHPDYRRELLGIAAQQGLRLEFHGFITPESALQVAAGASLGLAPLLDKPNYRESLPTKVLEYLAVGIPTLASDLPGTRRVIADMPGAVLVAPGDVTAWEAAIRDSLSDRELRAAARNGAPAVTRAYAWPAAEVRAFYAGLLPATGRDGEPPV